VVVVVRRRRRRRKRKHDVKERATIARSAEFLHFRLNLEVAAKSVKLLAACVSVAQTATVGPLSLEQQHNSMLASNTLTSLARNALQRAWHGCTRFTLYSALVAESWESTAVSATCDCKQRSRGAIESGRKRE
jgi:hypothetical protein